MKRLTTLRKYITHSYMEYDSVESRNNHTGSDITGTMCVGGGSEGMEGRERREKKNSWSIFFICLFP